MEWVGCLFSSLAENGWRLKLGLVWQGKFGLVWRFLMWLILFLPLQKLTLFLKVYW